MSTKTYRIFGFGVFLALFLSLGDFSYAQTGHRPKPYLNITSILASDTFDGDRNSSEILKMVDFGGGRSARLGARYTGRKYGSEPFWYGWDGADSYEGLFSATWSGSLTHGLEKEAFYVTCAGHDGSSWVTIELHDGLHEYHYKIKASGAAKELNKIAGEFLPDWLGKINGDADGEFLMRKVDFYKDGERIGWQVAFDAKNLHLGYESFSAPLPPIPNPVQGLPPINPHIDFKDNKAGFTGKGFYDESKAEKFVAAEGEFYGKSGITITGTMDGGIVVVEGGGGGDVRIHAKARVRNGKFRFTEVGIKVDKVKTFFSGKFRFPTGDIEVFDLSWDWPAEWEKVIPLPDEEDNILMDPDDLDRSKL